MAITFNEVPAALRVPGIYTEVNASLSGTGVNTKKVLVIGQQTSTATATTNKVVYVSSKARAKSLFGVGSMLAAMIESFFNYNKQVELYALPVADQAGAVAASSEITVAATSAGADGSLSLYVNDVLVSIIVKKGETEETIAKNISDTINTMPSLPITATVQSKDKNKVLLTANHAGEIGNDISMNQNLLGESGVEGVALTLSSLANGAKNPDIAAALQAIDSVHYNYFIVPYTDQSNITALQNELDARYKALEQKGARAFIAKKGTLDEVLLFGKSSNAIHISCIDASNSVSPLTSWVATNAAVAIETLSIDPSLPLYNKRLPNLIAGKTRSLQERNTLLFNGITTHFVSIDTQVYLERQIMMYKQTPQGDADTSYLDIEIPETLDSIRNIQRTEAQKRFAGYKLAKTDEIFAAGQKVMTPQVFKGFLLDLYRRVFLEEKGWVQDYDNYKKTLLVQVNESDKTRIDWKDEPTLIGQFYIGVGLIEFI